MNKKIAFSIGLMYETNIFGDVFSGSSSGQGAIARSPFIGLSIPFGKQKK